jgi:pyruvate carboxylase subunit B
VAFLKGEAKVNVRKNENLMKEGISPVANSNGEYTVVVNGERFNVQVSEGLDASIDVKTVTSVAAPTVVAAPSVSDSVEISASLPGSVFKIVAKVGDELKEGDVVIILEAMKMEIEILAPKDGVLLSIDVEEGQNVEYGQLLATI